MDASLRNRLVLGYLVVLLLGMSLAAVLVWRAIEQAYIATQQENLLAQARLTAATLADASLPVEAAQPYMQTANVAPGIHARVIAEQGAVVIGLPQLEGNTSLQAPLAENSGLTSPSELLQRYEIRQALQGEPATAIRKVATAGNRRVLYAAAPILALDQSIRGIVYLATPLPPAGLPAGLIGQLATAVIIAILLAGAAGTLLARRLALPVEAIAQAATAVSSGDLNQSVPTDTGIRELKSLGRAFNTMTASLRQSDQARNAFIADVTHELRTPLTVIKGAIETLEDGALDDLDGRGPLLASMQRETDRLIRLVNDLLVLARADAGQLRLKIDPVNLGALARARCQHFAAVSSEKQVNLNVYEVPQPSRLCALGDADRLTQILDNLLDNAIRHTAAGSTVAITIRTTADQIQCAVSDQGGGIAADHLPFIFERFYRVEVARDRQTGGAGLGLAIARALVLAQAGNISASSVEGQGTTITFCLPSSADCHPTA